MALKLTKDNRRNVNACVSLIKALKCDDIRSFIEIARLLGYRIDLTKENNLDMTVGEVLDYFNDTQRKVVGYLINEAVEEESRRHEGGRWNY